MDDSPADMDEEYLKNLDLTFKSKSIPLTKIENQLSFPENSDELDKKLEECIKTKDLKIFKILLSKCWNLLREKSLINFLLLFIKKYKEGDIYTFPLFQNFVEFIKDPNIILDLSGKKDSLLMFFCQISKWKMVATLCQKKIELNLNYEDTMGRNALFYLKGVADDKNIIDLLVKKKIDINHKDKEGNTALHNALINNANIEFINNLIDIGNADFMIKNKKNKSSLELINLNLISKKNMDNNSIKVNIFNFQEVNKLIQIIKKKLSIQTTPNISQKSNDLNLSSQIQMPNFFKFPSISINKNNLNEINKNNEDDLNNNLYLQLKKNPSLIIDTQSKINDKKINNLSFAQKIEYFKQINKNKKVFLNFLKNSENYLAEKAKIIRALLDKNKKELKNRELELQKIIERIDEIDNEFNQANIRINENNYKINNITNEINQKQLSLLMMNPELRWLNKYQFIIKDRKNYFNYICNQLTIDLNDYCIYISQRNEQLKIYTDKIYGIIAKCINECLGNGYIASMYGSRSSGMCLPWSDIDIVINPINNTNTFYEPLGPLYQYLMKNNDFIDNIKLIDSAHVPIIKIQTKKEYNNLGVDISYEMFSHHGQECVNYIKRKANEYQPLTAITFALKTIFYKAKLNEPYKGGLSSYGIILLILYFLDIEKNRGRDISINNVGLLFFELLLFYSNRENFSINNPIILTQNVDYTAIYEMQKFPNCSFIIVDPLNPQNNVANNARQLNNILNAFTISIRALLECCECGCHYQHQYCLKEDKCNHNLLNTIFNAIKREDFDKLKSE